MESCLYTKCFSSSTRSRNYIDLLPVSSIRNWYYGRDPHNLIKLKVWPSSRLSSVKFTAKCQRTYNNGSCSTLSRRGVKAIRCSSSAAKEEVEISGSMLWMVKNECRKIQLFASAGLVACILLVPSADAVDSLKTFSCLLKECRLELAKCISNPLCAANMACLETCNNRPDETECEMKCSDLFENKVVDEFNECVVSRKRCVPQISDVGEFPVPNPSAIVKNFNFSDFTGKWYITSGLNPTFDTFDCQLHEFHVESDRLVGNLTWRIRTPDTGFFTRSAVQKFVHDPLQPGVLYNHNNEYLHYQDEWYILSSKIENKSDDYVFVYYRGRNDAWHGYGGAVIYSRSSVLPQSIVPELERAAKSVGLDFFSKFITTDNSCGPEPPLFERIERSVEEVEKAILREVEEIKEEAERGQAIKGFRLDVDYLE